MQTILVFVLFAAALGYVGWRAYRRLSAKADGCGKGCGCAADSAGQAGKRSAKAVGAAPRLR